MSKMTYIDGTLGRINFLCAYTGIDIENKREEENKTTYKKRIIFYLSFVSLSLDIAAAFNYLIHGILSGESFVNITFSAPCIIYCLLSDFKLLTLLFNSEKTKDLINVLRRMETENLQEVTPEKGSILTEEMSFLHRLLKSLNVAYCGLLIGFSLNPLSITAYNYLKHGKVMLVLPFLARYPFGTDGFAIWSVVYLRQVWSVITVVMYVVLVDYLFYTYALYIRIQFRLLQHSLESLLQNNSTKTFPEIEFRFKKLVVWHNELILCTQQLEAIYSKSILCNFVSSSILICLTGFDVMVITDIMIVISFVSFLLTSLLQIFFLCFFGDMLMRSSTEIGDAAYKSQWYSKDPRIGKSLLILMTRSQRACKLTAFNFAEVNLTAFMRILKNAWSYFALLKTVYGLK